MWGSMEKISTPWGLPNFFIIAKTKNCLQEPASVRLKQFLGYNTCNILNDLDEPNNCKFLHSLTENN